ncbi:beta-glucosidase [Sphaerisporangium melleum]|uniref:Beta-glucosidase n=1 Tax=Sphaerisporangium melleum TaxID=321316 RepID=A0A917R6T1_9ACTN|nr:GH1 family beta-glucosidase [Sphaerisporangium melleum]GGK93220.1 beta-glucosidase [Sphaerisporangium melleum]GII73437.1 beta-glucosidase [Sphaerisporangium melleum]
MPEQRFPDEFVWGAATSAYQIEGAAGEDGRGVSVWDTFCAVPGNVKDGDTGAVAADHYHRHGEDLDLMASLGLRGYRFSIAWPRVQPDGAGKPEQRGLDFYRRLVDGLRERGIAPMATLFHWDLPQALQDAGGWENRDTAARFADYAAIVFDALDIRDWLTVNEPKTVVECGHRWGIHAPGVQDDAKAFVVLHHLLLGHGLAAQALHQAHPGRRIGPALNLHPSYAADPSPAAAKMAWHQDGLENRLYLDPIFTGAYPEDTLAWIGERSPMPERVLDGDLAVISEPIDVLGVQYYTPRFVDGEGNRVQKYPTAQLDWLEVYPRGLYDTLMRLKSDYPEVPIVITENGVPAPDEVGPDGRVADPGRVAFLRDHLTAVRDALAEGVPVEGYYVWSLLDNFEWAEGYSARFGIVHVDYATQRRTPKDSALWYRDLITTGLLP